MTEEGFRPDDDPTPVVPVPDIGPDLARCRRRRRARLLALWTAVALLLALQAAVATHLRARRARLEAGRPPASLPAKVAEARPATRPVAPASRPSTRPAATSQATARIEEPAPPPRRRAKRAKAAKRGGAKARTTGRAAKAERLPLPRGPVDDVTVPASLAGDPGKGERLFRMGCGLCHGRSAPAVNPTRFSVKQWSTYFARGAHARHAKLGAHFTRSELADVKAYLRSAAEGR